MGRVGGLVNQRRTGTISRTTLMDILGGGVSEHLRTCPEYSDDDPVHKLQQWREMHLLFVIGNYRNNLVFGRKI